jgi:hypothetical protein
VQADAQVKGLVEIFLVHLEYAHVRQARHTHTLVGNVYAWPFPVYQTHFQGAFRKTIATAAATTTTFRGFRAHHLRVCHSSHAVRQRQANEAGAGTELDHSDVSKSWVIAAPHEVQRLHAQFQHVGHLHLLPRHPVRRHVATHGPAHIGKR